MLRYLNQIDFSPFGKIIPGKSSSCGETLNISGPYADVFRQYETSVCLDIVSGICALCLRNEAEICTFLLDKPVMLKPEICFSLTAVDNSCTVRLWANGAKPHMLYPQKSFAPSKQAPRLVIRDIVSFLYQECEFGLRTVSESHSFFELTYVDSGKIINIVDGKEYVTSQGEMMLFFPEQVHMQKNSPNTSSSFITVGFDMSMADCEALKNRIFRADSVIRGIYSEILSEYQIFDEYSSDMLIGYIRHILLHLMRYNTGHIPPLSAHEINHVTAAAQIRNNISNRLVKSAIDYIDTHIEKKLSLVDIAGVLNLNPAYMSRLFKEHAGICITDYIKLQKLGRAKKLLKSGGYTVTEISEMFSFSSIHYFSNCFKKEFGISPADYAGMLHG